MQRVNVVGAGLAGLSAARTLAVAGIPVRLISPQQSERAQSVLAEGGINAALNTMGENDTPEEHFIDTMRGGVWLADPNAVWGMAQGAPSVVHDLHAIGAPLHSEDGHLVQRPFGGQKKRRTAYAKSSTGKALVTALIDAVRAFEASGLVERYARHEMLALELQQDACVGLWVRNVYTGEELFFPGPVVMCAGGMGGMFGAQMTGTTQNTGDIAAALYAQGVEMGNPEFFQYHPTTVPITGKRMLISEAARGEGGRLFTLKGGKKWYFMEEKYPELGNLMPRDVVSREEWYVMHDPECADQVWLDMTGLTKEAWVRVSDLRDECIHYLGIDPAKEPFVVEPGIHYCMGGVQVDEAHRTNIKGLYAAGECAAQYHGANRLGGNSLLGAVYGGRVVAHTVASEFDADAPCAVPEKPVFSLGSVEVILSDNPIEARMQQIIRDGLGIIRERSQLEQGLKDLESMDTTGASERMLRRIALARGIFKAALLREESRGAHTRSDFPETKAAFRCTTILSAGADGPQVVFRPLPCLREGDAKRLLESGVPGCGDAYARVAQEEAGTL